MAKPSRYHQDDRVEISASGKKIPRTRACYNLRDVKGKDGKPLQEEDGTKLIAGVGAMYASDGKTGVLRRLDKAKPGKAARKAEKRARQEARRAVEGGAA